MALLRALLNTVLPVFILAGLGWTARKVLKVQVKDVATMGIYIFTPGLLANSILTTQLMAGEIGKIAGYVVLLTFGMIAITLGLFRLLGWKPSERSAAVLSTAFMNSANYGMPVTLLAFGQAGFDRAAVYVIIETLLMYTVAVYFAAKGKMDAKQAILAVFKLPLVWAAAFALLVRFTGIELPIFVAKPIKLLADGAISLVAIVLGMQLAGIALKGNRVKIGVTTFLRLIVSPVLGLALVALLKPDPLTASVLVLESSMPAAVNTTLLSVQFDAEPDQVSGATLMTTVLSLVTVTFWVWFLQR